MTYFQQNVAPNSMQQIPRINKAGAVLKMDDSGRAGASKLKWPENAEKN